MDVAAAVGSAELDFSRWACPPGRVNSWAALLYSPADVVARTLLYAPGVATLDAAPLAAAAVFFGAFAIVTYGLAIPSGIFFPGVVIGAAAGRLLGVGVAAVWTARPAGTPVVVEAYALVGVVAVLAGITRTVSVAIIVLEATGAFTASYAAAVAALIAKAVSDALVADGIYDTHIKLKGMPWLPATPPRPHMYERVLVNDLMVRRVVGVRRRVPVGDLVALLRRSTHNAFPVFLKLAAPATDAAAAAAATTSAVAAAVAGSGSTVSGEVTPRQRPGEGVQLAAAEAAAAVRLRRPTRDLASATSASQAVLDRHNRKLRRRVTKTRRHGTARGPRQRGGANAQHRPQGTTAGKVGGGRWRGGAG